MSAAILAAILLGMGGSSPVFLQNRSISDTGVIFKGSGSAAADLSVNNDGSLSSTSFVVNPAFDADEWLPSGSAADYDVMCEYVSGDNLTTGNEGTWLNCGTSRVFGIGLSGGLPDTSSGTFNLKFRKAGSGGTLISKSLTLSAEIG